MEPLIVLIGGITLCSIMNLKNKKENFEETYYDSESYTRQNLSAKESTLVNKYSPSVLEANKNIKLSTGDPDFKFSPFDNRSKVYTLDTPELDDQSKWIKNNSLYLDDKINGIPLKDYYNTYTKSVLDKGEWFLNKDMPQDTKQYRDGSDVQRRMEIYTGLLQKRDRETLGVPTKQETLNMFTPAEKTTGYGYQYGQSGTGPGLSITRAKELEDLKQDIKFKKNEQPFEKIKVGRGLALGTEVPAAGGFQQFTRVLPSNISDYSSNQLPGRVAGGKWVFSNAPTSQQPVLKNRPNGYYSLCQRGPAAGKSTLTAETLRPDVAVLLRNQNRTTINYGFGAPLTNLESFLEK
jgi:Family of unknown function (DUF5899)